MRKRTLVGGVALASIVAAIFTTAKVSNRSRLTSPAQTELEAVFPGGSYDIFANAEALVLLSLDPRPPGSNESSAPDFHGYKVLGQATIEEPDQRKKIRSVYYDAINLRNKESQIVECFNPAHGIRAVRGEDSVDILICFSCGNGKMFHNQREEHSFHLWSRHSEDYDSILRQHGVRLASDKASVDR